MTSTLVIDTNVLEYLFDDATHNADGHIDEFLKAFVEKRRNIGLDRPAAGQSSRIIGEYKHRLQYHLKQASDQTLRTQWLRYVLEFADRIDVPVNLADSLGKCIRSKIGHRTRVRAETSDQLFVYVASALDCVMVSDNKAHINHHAKQLRRCARSHDSNNTDFLSSVEAAAAA